ASNRNELRVRFRRARRLRLAGSITADSLENSVSVISEFYQAMVARVGHKEGAVLTTASTKGNRVGRKLQVTGHGLRCDMRALATMERAFSFVFCNELFHQRIQPRYMAFAG